MTGVALQPRITERVIPTIDPSLLSLRPDEATFFKEQTGIQGDEELKAHILAVQKEAYDVRRSQMAWVDLTLTQVWPYPCIHHFGFTRLKISRFSAYQQVLKLGRERDGATLLDIGCCVGNDARKAAADGFPADQIIASDLCPEFWDIGNKLFCTTPERCRIRFIAADAFDDAMLSATPAPTPATLDLKTISSLNELKGRLSAIHASSFFHLFSQEQQADLAKRLATLLSPLPGSVILGSHLGNHVAGQRAGRISYGHSPESWSALWDGGVFPKGKVAVRATIREVDELHLFGVRDTNVPILVWLAIIPLTMTELPHLGGIQTVNLASRVVPLFCIEPKNAHGIWHT